MSKRKATSSSGCMHQILAGLLSIILLVFIRGFLGFPMILAVGISVVLSIYFTNQLLGKPSKRINWFSLVFLMTIIGVVAMGLQFLNEELRRENSGSSDFEGLEGVNKTILKQGEDSIAVFASNRVWRDNYGNSYQARLMVREQDYEQLKTYLRSYRPDLQTNFWGKLYNYMEQQDVSVVLIKTLQ